MNSAKQYNTVELAIFKDVTKCSLSVPLAFPEHLVLFGSWINAHIQFPYAASRYHTSAKQKLIIVLVHLSPRLLHTEA